MAKGINIDKDVLYEKYIIEEKSMLKIAKELGYWVDGYDKLKNVVIEFDEKYNNKPQNEIIKHLKCDFIRLNENGEEKLKIKYNGERN